MVSSILEYINDIHLFSLMLGLVLLLMGFITVKFPPKKINMLYGYRTPRSMKNQKNWDFAQEFATKEMIRGGWILTAFSLSGMFYPASTLVDTMAGTTLMIVIFVLLAVRTEKSIKDFENRPDSN